MKQLTMYKLMIRQDDSYTWPLVPNRKLKIDDFIRDLIIDIRLKIKTLDVFNQNKYHNIEIKKDNIKIYVSVNLWKNTGAKLQSNPPQFIIEYLDNNQYVWKTRLYEKQLQDIVLGNMTELLIQEYDYKKYEKFININEQIKDFLKYALEVFPDDPYLSAKKTISKNNFTLKSTNADHNVYEVAYFGDRIFFSFIVLKQEIHAIINNEIDKIKSVLILS